MCVCLIQLSVFGILLEKTFNGGGNGERGKERTAVFNNTLVFVFSLLLSLSHTPTHAHTHKTWAIDLFWTVTVSGCAEDIPQMMEMATWRLQCERTSPHPLTGKGQTASSLCVSKQNSSSFFLTLWVLWSFLHVTFLVWYIFSLSNYGFQFSYHSWGSVLRLCPSSIEITQG